MPVQLFNQAFVQPLLALEEIIVDVFESLDFIQIIPEATEGSGEESCGVEVMLASHERSHSLTNVYNFLSEIF